jgi:hypothetical protein
MAVQLFEKVERDCAHGRLGASVSMMGPQWRRMIGPLSDRVSPLGIPQDLCLLYSNGILVNRSICAVYSCF